MATVIAGSFVCPHCTQEVTVELTKEQGPDVEVIAFCQCTGSMPREVWYNGDQDLATQMRGFS